MSNHQEIEDYESKCKQAEMKLLVTSRKLLIRLRDEKELTNLTQDEKDVLECLFKVGKRLAWSISNDSNLRSPIWNEMILDQDEAWS